MCANEAWGEGDLNVILWDLILSKLVRVRVVSVSYLRRVSLGYDADTTRIRTGATQIRHGYDTDNQKRQTFLSKIRSHRKTSNQTTIFDGK